MVQERIRGKVVAESLQRGDAVGGATFVIGAEATNVINVGIQLEDERGADIAFAGSLQAYLSDDADGQTVAAAPDTVAIGTDGTLVELGTDFYQLISETDGDIDINITEAGGADTFYLNLVMPTGKLVTSSAITFA